MILDARDQLRGAVVAGIEQAEKEVGVSTLGHIDESEPHRLRFTLYADFCELGISLIVTNDFALDLEEAKILGYEFAKSCINGAMQKVVPGEPIVEISPKRIS